MYFLWKCKTKQKTTKHQWILFLSQLDSTGNLYHPPESCFPTIKSVYASQGRTRLFIFSFCSNSRGYWNVFEEEQEKQTLLNISRLICVEKLSLKWKGDMLLCLLFSRSLILKLIIYKMDIIYPSLRWIIKMQDSDTTSHHFRCWWCWSKDRTLRNTVLERRGPMGSLITLVHSRGRLK